MWSTVKALGRDILTSKKAIATLAAIIVTALSRAGVAVDPETAQWVAGSLGAYVLGQGMADVGKEKAKHETAAAAFGAKPKSRGKK